MKALLGCLYIAPRQPDAETTNEPLTASFEWRKTMSKFKIIVLSALIILTFSVTVVGDAMARERIEFRAKHCNVGTRWEPVEIGDEPGHVIALSEAKGIGVIIEGTPGGPYKLELHEMVELRGDGTGTSTGYGKATYPDGSSYYLNWRGVSIKDGHATGSSVYYGGTGRFKGMKGGEDVDCLLLGDRFRCDVDAWIELP
jgi:hypothetical protein